MAKKWNQLTDSEKIEDLRRDILSIIARVNQIDKHSDVLQNGVSEVAEKLENLEHRVAAAEKALTAAEKIPKSRAKRQKS